MRFAIVNLGCKVNRVESDGFAQLLLSKGLEQVAEQDADLIVVNTCTVTGEAEKKARKAVRHALRANGRAFVVVTGCAAAIDAAEFSEMDPRVSVVPKAGMALFLEERVSNSGGSDPAVPAACPAYASRTRVGVKVQDGCDNACTYCIVHVARGRATSRPMPDIVDDVRTLAGSGVREIVLSGINIGSYRFEGAHLGGLARRLLDETAGLSSDGLPRVRFRVSSVEPMDVEDDFVDVLADAGGRICRHLHLPLQSGSSKVLAEMARPYDAGQFVDLVARLRSRVPELSLSTDVIVGFPGETEDDFLETCRVARTCGFSKIHVFPYSRRDGTPAAERTDQVPAAVKSERTARLRKLASELRAHDYHGRIGAEELAVVEDDGRAMTESYYEIEPPVGARPGDLVRVVLPEIRL